MKHKYIIWFYHFRLTDVTLAQFKRDFCHLKYHSKNMISNLKINCQLSLITEKTKTPHNLSNVHIFIELFKSKHFSIYIIEHSLLVMHI